MEIGSFIEIDLRNSGEYYNRETDIARLNSARAGIYHAIRILDCSVIYLPYYLCHVVRDFMALKGIHVRYYSLSEEFEPLIGEYEKNAALLIVNYFGILSHAFISDLGKKFRNIIIDNSQAFFCQPSASCYSVYSPRKFFGVPDGCYVIGKKAGSLLNEYGQDYSSDTAAYLLKRIEFGSSAVYEERMKNENRISNSDIMTMSILTRALLANVDYESIKTRRQMNFRYAHNIFGTLNMFDPMLKIDDETVPMVYPLVIEDSTLVEKLKGSKIYTGRWWKHVLSQVNEYSFEAKLSKFMIPIPIDQRYGFSDLDFIKRELIT